MLKRFPGRGSHTMAQLTRAGYVLSKPSPLLDRVRRELTVAPERDGEVCRSASFRVFAESPTAVYLPRHYAESVLGLPKGTWKGGAPKACPMTFKGELKESTRQPEAVAASLDALKNQGGGILSLPTGYGKTTVALYLACQMGLKTLVVTHKEFLMDQWIERIAQFIPDARVGKIQQDVCDVDKDIVVAMIHSICLKDYGNVFRDFGLLILDEVHHVSAPMFSRCMFKALCPHVLGLSATPYRKDGLTKVIEWFVGPVFFKVTRTEQRHVRVICTNYACEEYSRPVPLRPRLGTIDMPEIISRLTNDATRNAMIVSRTRSFFRQGRKIMVLSDRRGHCQDLCKQLEDCRAALYLGGMSQDALKNATEAPVIIATFSQANEGLDIPSLNTLVLATPKPDVIQAVGRILREAAGTQVKHSPIVFDIIDQYSVFFAQFNKRRAWYTSSGFEVIRGKDAAPAEDRFAFADDE